MVHIVKSPLKTKQFYLEGSIHFSVCRLNFPAFLVDAVLKTNACMYTLIKKSYSEYQIQINSKGHIVQSPSSMPLAANFYFSHIHHADTIPRAGFKLRFIYKINIHCTISHTVYNTQLSRPYCS